MNTPKISIIICSIEAGKFARICESYKMLMADTPYEIIGIHDAKSLAEGYNRGITQARGDILVFSHDDILIIDNRFAAKICERIQRFDLLGFAGTSRLVNGTWFGAGPPHLHGVVSHCKAKARHLSIDVFGVDQWPVVQGIQAVDGLCIIATREVAKKVGFDATTFDGFHLYDLDFSFAAHLAGFRLGICCDIPIIHESAGNFDDQHRIFADRFVAKHLIHLAPPSPQNTIGRPPGRAAQFQTHEALQRAWQKSVLQRATVAIRRPKPGKTTST